jgi:hypothetical protein
MRTTLPHVLPDSEQQSLYINPPTAADDICCSASMEGNVATLISILVTAVTFDTNVLGA